MITARYTSDNSVGFPLVESAMRFHGYIRSYEICLHDRGCTCPYCLYCKHGARLAPNQSVGAPGVQGDVLIFRASVCKPYLVINMRADSARADLILQE
jgi:hypothetical protein